MPQTVTQPPRMTNLQSAGRGLSEFASPFLPRPPSAYTAAFSPGLGDAALRRARALARGRVQLDTDRHPPDPALGALLDADTCLKHDILPWSRDGDLTLLACLDIDRTLTLRGELAARIGRFRPMLVSRDTLHAEIAAQHGPALVRQAETWVPDDESCRDINQLSPRRALVAVLAVALCLLGLMLEPGLFVLACTALALLSLLSTQGLKAAALLTRHLAQSPRTTAPPQTVPLVSVLVPLFHETGIADRLVRRLARLSYPKSRLEVLLILEAQDSQTRAVLDACVLPPWMRVIEVPPGSITTKPRALNYALRFARGEIVGVYDAEDAPASDQIERVVARFEAAPPETACLQGILDFYNPHANWLSRCFTIEYATWFRVILPGLERMGFAIPLGGTTVFFRRAALEHLRGWDAHNVTEDADLGLRLARHGYRTEVIESVTLEEANNRLWPWVRQRSRWLKGYFITYLVHMRAPGALWRSLGPKRFLGVQLVFLSALLHFTLAPVLWSFWLIQVGMAHPVAGLSPDWVLGATIGLFLTSEAVTLLAAFLAIGRTRHRGLLIWVPTMMLYFPLGVLAMYKALWEVVVCPFYWDKTSHGHSPDTALPEVPARPP